MDDDAAWASRPEHISKIVNQCESSCILTVNRQLLVLVMGPYGPSRYPPTSGLLPLVSS